jgi:hypothetical protein
VLSRNQHPDSQNDVVSLQQDTGETVLAAEGNQVRKEQIKKLLLTLVLKQMLPTSLNSFQEY